MYPVLSMVLIAAVVAGTRVTLVSAILTPVEITENPALTACERC